MRSFALVFALVAIACGRQLNEHRSINPALDWRVVGGSPAEDAQFPFIVSMRGPSGSHTCGGSIISSRFVLSAGHCVYRSSPSELTFVAGSNTLSSGGTSHTVARILLNGYDDFTGENDVSLLEVSNEFAFGPNVASIPYAVQHVDEPVGVTLIGWGTTSFPGSIPDRLQYLPTLNTITHVECQQAWSNSDIFTSNICTAGREGYGACHGDSGGPLINTATRGLVGLVSWGAPCGVGWPDVYVRVSSHASWITSTLES